MSKQSIQDLSADHRRAASLIIHYGKTDNEGINAILTESMDAGRVVPLIFAILSVYDQLGDELRSDVGQAVLSSVIHDLAGQEQ
ncbi:hypothetical protein [Arthrobacter sp. H14]|uniref:hypothetical protein n=1 Tax=Arthrobacter sp. H14 TaxID=1312959 RepID=UPI0004B46806|nr:hypothetical protein [Arthrobacter sp. H14]